MSFVWLPTTPPHLSGHHKRFWANRPRQVKYVNLPTSIMSLFANRAFRIASQQRYICTMRLIFDFDGTITQKDTIGELAQAAINHRRQADGTDLQQAWDNAVQAYLADYRLYKSNFDPPESNRTEVAQERKFLAGFKAAEEASLSRVSKAGLFAGLQKKQLFRMGQEAVSSGNVTIRDGFKELVSLARERNVPVGVVSVNWSRSYIQGVIQDEQIDVIANEVSEDGYIHGPSFLESRLTTAPDKLLGLRQIIGTGHDGEVFYFGDSPTDLDCLLVDRGIVMATDEESSPLLKMLSRVGVQVPQVGSKQQGISASKIFWARDFRELLDSRILLE